jgi:hypothetical protein
MDSPVLKDVTRENPTKPTAAMAKAMGILITKRATSAMIPIRPIEVVLIFPP